MIKQKSVSADDVASSDNQVHVHQDCLKDNVSFLNHSEMQNINVIFQTIRGSKQLIASNWTSIVIYQLSEKFSSVEPIMIEHSKQGLQICTRATFEKLKADNIKFSVLGNKKKAVFLNSLTQ